MFNSPRGPQTGSLWPVDLLCVLELILGLCLGIEICVYKFECVPLSPGAQVGTGSICPI